MGKKKTGSEARVKHRQELAKLIKQAAYSHAVYQVFEDFLEITAITLSNTADLVQREPREKRYLEIIGSYAERERDLFPQMLVHLVEALEEKAQADGPEDILGLVFNELELGSRYKGQFFTPRNVSDMMAQIACGDKLQSAIQERGYIAMCDPTCGSGVMLTSFCKAMKKEGLNYNTQLVATACDIDLKCAHMAYIHLSLYGVPAVVVHGNSLTAEEWSRWYTPVYLANGWIFRQSCGISEGGSEMDEAIKRALYPEYDVLMRVLGMCECAKESAEAGSES